MKEILKNKKIVASVVLGSVTLVLLGSVALCQNKYDNAIVYASELNATTTLAKYQDQGLLVRPDTINKIINEADAEALALEEQAILISEKEATLENTLATSNDFNDSENETLETIKADYETAKTTYSGDTSLNAGETYLATLTSLQEQYDLLLSEHQARLEHEAIMCSNEYGYSTNDAWGGNNSMECVGEDPVYDTTLVTSSNDICTWLHGWRSYIGLSEIECEVTEGIEDWDSEYWGGQFLPPYEYVKNNIGQFPELMTGKDEDYIVHCNVEFKDGIIRIDFRNY